MTADLHTAVEAARADLAAVASRYRDAAFIYTGRGATPRSNGRRAGKPGSKPPAGTDRQLRACLVDCARAISDATWHLRDHGLPTKPWRPTSFTDETTGRTVVDLGIAWQEPTDRRTCASCGQRWHGEHTDHTDACKHPEESVRIVIVDRWAPDGDDLAVAVPHPNQVDGECERLRGNLGLLATRGVDDEHLANALRAIRRARAALRRAGLEPPPRDTAAQRCANEPCRNYPRPGGRECGTCANWRSRHGEPRTINDERVSSSA